MIKKGVLLSTIVLITALISLCGIAYSAVKYEIVKEGRTRYDGGALYYVLIPAVNVENDKFKNDVKTVIQSLIKEKGSKFSAKIFDNKKALESNYKIQEGPFTGKVSSKNETNFNSLHLVAWFSGNLKTGEYFNEINFYPGGTDLKKVGKYSSTEEYNENLNTTPNNDYENKMADRSKVFEKQLSSWDGSHAGLVKTVKEKLNDPASFEHVETRYSDMKSHFVIMMKFRCKNAFGGTVTNTVKAKVSDGGQLLEIFK